MANNHHRTIAQTRNPTHNRFIICKGTVACQLIEIIESQTQIIEGIRALWMARQLRNLPCSQVGEDFTRQFYAFFTQTMHFFVDVNIQFFILTAHCGQGIDFRFQLGNRLFEIKEIQTHNIPVLVKLQFHLLRTNQATQIVQ